MLDVAKSKKGLVGTIILRFFFHYFRLLQTNPCIASSINGLSGFIPLHLQVVAKKWVDHRKCLVVEMVKVKETGKVLVRDYFILARMQRIISSS
jgi:hypothetical protein